MPDTVHWACKNNKFGMGVVDYYFSPWFEVVILRANGFSVSSIRRLFRRFWLPRLSGASLLTITGFAKRFYV